MENQTKINSVEKKSRQIRHLFYNESPILLDVDELAKALNVHKSWIYSRTRETGPAAMPRIRCGKYLRFELDAVMNWLKKKNEVR
jgi:excisionase family DNA binding protein